MPTEDSKHAAYLGPELDKLLESVFSLFHLLETEVTLSEKGRRYLTRAEEEVHRVALSTNPALNRFQDKFPAALSSGSHRVLCIDDEPYSLGRRQAILEYGGCVVSTAKTFSEALAFFQSRDFDLVITNHLLGPETGTATIREMKRLKPHVPVIVISGSSDLPEDSKDIETADAFIGKSELPESLLAMVDELAFRSRSTPARGVLRKERRSSAHKVQLLAGIVESSADAIFGKSLDGTILTWNKAAESIYGYRAEEVIGKSVTLLQPLDRHGEVHSILRRLENGEKVDHIETTAVAKGGRMVGVSLTISPIMNAAGQIIGASTIAREITRSTMNQ